MDVEAEAEALDKAEIMLKDLYRNLTLGESVKLRVILKASLYRIRMNFSQFTPLSGDRNFGRRPRSCWRYSSI